MATPALASLPVRHFEKESKQRALQSTLGIQNIQNNAHWEFKISKTMQNNALWEFQISNDALQRAFSLILLQDGDREERNGANQERTKLPDYGN